MKTYTKAILSLVFCISLLFFVLQVPAVKKVILEKTIAYALNEPKHKVHIEKVTGFFPFSVQVKKCSLKDPGGTWLELDDIKLSLRLLPFKVKFFELKRLDLQRIPAFENTIDISLPEMLPMIVAQTMIQSLKIEQILIAPQILGRGYDASLLLEPTQEGGQNLELTSSTEGKVSTTFVSEVQNYKKGILLHFKGSETPTGIFSALLKENTSLPKGNIQVEGVLKIEALKIDTDGNFNFSFAHSEWGKVDIQANQKEKIVKGKAELTLINQNPYILDITLDNKKTDGFLIPFFKLFQEEALHIEGDILVKPKAFSVPNLLDVAANLSIFSSQTTSDKPFIALTTNLQVDFLQKALQCKGTTKAIDGAAWLEEKIGKYLEWNIQADFQRSDIIHLEKVILSSEKGDHLDGSVEFSGKKLKGKFTTSLASKEVLKGKQEPVLLETTMSGSLTTPTLLTKIISPTTVPMHLKEILIEGNLESKDLWTFNIDLKGGDNKVVGKARYNTGLKTVDLNLIAELNDLYPWHHLEKPLRLEITLDQALSGKGTASIKDLKLGAVYFSEANLSFTLAEGKGDYQLKATGRKRLKRNKAPHQILSSQGQIDLRALILTIKEFSFTPENHKVVLTAPCKLDFDAGKLDSFVLSLNKGKASIEKLQWQTSSAPLRPWNGYIALENIPFSLLQMLDNEASLQGGLSGHINISGNQSFPILNGKITIAALSSSTFTEQKIKGLDSLNAAIDFDWRMDALKWDLECQGGPTLSLFAKGKIGVENGRIQPYSQIESTMKGSLYLGVFSAFLGSGDRINGVLSTDLGVHGTVENPNLKGTININSGLYELSDYGTLIHDINLSAEAKGSEIMITSLTAHDGAYHPTERGNLIGKGFIRLQSWTIPYVDIQLDLKDFRIAQSDSFVGKASGSLFLKGEGAKAKITGDVGLASTGLFLEEAASPEIPTIDIISSEGKAKSDATSKDEEKPKEILPIELKLNAPGNFSIVGFGLESTWKGSMIVVGSLLDTQLMGMITVEKGKLDIFGKTLKLKEGKVIYDNHIKNDPLLFIKAVREVDSDTTVTLIIEGRSSNPRFTLMSVPAYPEEEILSRLLFGKSVGSISVGQSLQLASAAASMNGQKGLNVMDKIRSSFGLDTLELKESKKADAYDTSGGQALSIGKEFGNVKVSIDQGVSTGTSKATLEADIGHNLNVDVDIGGDQSSGVGLNWVKRY